MKSTKTLRFGVLCGSALLMSLLSSMGQAEAQISPAGQAEGQVFPGCYIIRSLNRNFQTDSTTRYLGLVQTNLGTPSSSDGRSATTQMIQTREDLGLAKKGIRRFWQVTSTAQGSILTLVRGNSGSNLDGASDGSSVVLHPSNNVTHGQYWQITRDGDGYRIRSLNNNFRNQNYRWLDGASDGRTVQLVNGKSHGTLWEFTFYSPKCP